MPASKARRLLSTLVPITPSVEHLTREPQAPCDYLNRLRCVELRKLRQLSSRSAPNTTVLFRQGRFWHG